MLLLLFVSSVSVCVITWLVSSVLDCPPVYWVLVCVPLWAVSLTTHIPQSCVFLVCLCFSLCTSLFLVTLLDLALLFCRTVHWDYSFVRLSLFLPGLWLFFVALPASVYLLLLQTCLPACELHLDILHLIFCPHIQHTQQEYTCSRTHQQVDKRSQLFNY